MEVSSFRLNVCLESTLASEHLHAPIVQQDSSATIQQYLRCLAVQGSFQITEAQPAPTVQPASVASPLALSLNVQLERIALTF